MQERDRFSDILLRNDLRRLNSHLPKIRKTLRDLLNDPLPRVQSVSGDMIKMRKNELEELTTLLPEDAKDRVRLPIILQRRSDLGTGAFAVFGDPYEEYAVAILSGSAHETFEEYKPKRNGPLILYKPQVSMLLRRFHSLLTIGFGTVESHD